jgi:hypothetical protein
MSTNSPRIRRIAWRKEDTPLTVSVGSEYLGVTSGTVYTTVQKLAQTVQQNTPETLSMISITDTISYIFQHSYSIDKELKQQLFTELFTELQTDAPTIANNITELQQVQFSYADEELLFYLQTENNDEIIERIADDESYHLIETEPDLVVITKQISQSYVHKLDTTYFTQLNSVDEFFTEQIEVTHPRVSVGVNFESDKHTLNVRRTVEQTLE